MLVVPGHHRPVGVGGMPLLSVPVRFKLGITGSCSGTGSTEQFRIVAGLRFIVSLKTRPPTAQSALCGHVFFSWSPRLSLSSETVKLSQSPQTILWSHQVPWPPPKAGVGFWIGVLVIRQTLSGDGFPRFSHAVLQTPVGVRLCHPHGSSHPTEYSRTFLRFRHLL